MKSRRKNMSRLASLLLAVAMLVTSLPQSALSASAAEVSSAVETPAAGENVAAGGEAKTAGEAAAKSGKEAPEGEAAEDSATPGDAAGIGEAQTAGEAAAEDGNTVGNAATKTEGETTEDGKPADGGNKPADETDESDKPADEANEGNEPADEEGEDPSGQEASDNAEDEDETGQDSGLGDADEEEDLAGDEPSLGEDEEAHEPVWFRFEGDRKTLTVYDITEGDNNKVIDDGGGYSGRLSMPYGSTESFKFKIVPKNGYVIAMPFFDSYITELVNIDYTMDDGVYECTVSPKDETAGYIDFYQISFSIKAIKKASNRLTFVYPDEVVEELALTNAVEEDYKPVSNNTPIVVTNEYNTSFKLKAKAGKVPAVSYQAEGDDSGESLRYLDYNAKDDDGYYCYDLGTAFENAIITIKDGCTVTFDYKDAEIEEFYRYTLVHEEDGDWFNGSGEPVTGHVLIAAKGEPIYFYPYLNEDDYWLCRVSVTDASGNACEYTEGEEGGAYKADVQADMTIKIELIPMSLPVTYEEGVVKNLSITATDNSGALYNAEEKKITNLYSCNTEFDLSFELEEGKVFDRAELVYDNSWYDWDEEEYIEDYYYYKIDVEETEEGIYSSTSPFNIDDWCCIELRIIAGDAYQLTFKPEGEARIYKFGEYKEPDVSQALNEDNPQTVVKGDEYTFFVAMECGKYELATPCVIAEAEEKPRELETEYRDTRWIEDDNGDKEGKEFNFYICTITPTADTTVSALIKPQSIPLKFTQGALKDIEVAGGAALSWDESSIDINNWDEINNCEISFTLEENKIYSHAYCGYTAYSRNDWNDIDRSKTSTYTRAIGEPSFDDATKRYTIGGIGEFDRELLVSIDYVQIVAGDACEITFDLPEDIKNHVLIFEFNNYDNKDIDAEKLSVETVMGEEYLFRIELGGEYGASTVSVTAGDKEEELPVRYYTMPEWPAWEPGIAYYGFTPTEAASKVKVSLSPKSIPVKYADGAVASLKLEDLEFEYGYAPKLSEDMKTVDIWGYDIPLTFDLQLESGKKLSRIFSRHIHFDEYGNKTEGYDERDTEPFYDEESGSYRFAVNLSSWDLVDIEIVTDKVNLADCNVELALEKNAAGYYCAKYQARDIEPEVIVTYAADADETGAPVTLDKSEYIVTYENNRDVCGWFNAGEPGEKPIGNLAVVIVKAKDDSGCTGSNIAEFNIVKADAPEVDPFNISVDINDIKENRELNLTGQITINTKLGEKGITATEYVVDTEDAANTKGGVLVDDPWIERNWENKNYNLVYNVAADADEQSAKAVVVLKASFENYDDARIVINLSMSAKTLLKFSEFPYYAYKKYDGLPFEYDLSNLYLVDDNEEMLEDSDAIIEELGASLRFHYTGYIDTGKEENYYYDSYEAPTNAGSYKLTLEISEENPEYRAEPYTANYIYISRREITFRADSVTVDIGDPLPEAYSYRTTGDGLLPGDSMTAEPVLSCEAKNTETLGKYDITVDTSDIDIVNSEGQSVKHNYSFNTYSAKLTVAETSKTAITLSKKADAQLTKTYDGSEFDGEALIGAKLDEADITDAQITIKYAGRGDTVYPISEAAPVDAGTYTMTAKVSAKDTQYKSNELELDIEITKAQAPDLQEKVISVQPVTEDVPGTLNLAGYFTGGYEVVSYGAVTKTDEDNVLAAEPSVSANGELSYTLKAGAAAGEAVLTIPIVFRNYQDASLRVKIALTSKTILTLSEASGVEVNREYNGSAYVLPAEAVSIAGLPQDAAETPKLTYTYTIDGNTGNIGPVHAGRYTVTVDIAEDDEHYAAAAALSISFEITKKTVTVTANDGEWNKTFDSRPTSTSYAPGCSKEGLVDGESLVSEPTSYTYTYTSNGETVTLADEDEAWKALEAGTQIKVTPAGAKADDYEIAYAAGTLTVADIPEGDQLFVKPLQPMVYTGSQLKPAVQVYVRKNNGLTELTSKDYKVTYGTNKEAGKDAGTVTVIGKGNYADTVTVKFDIEAASIGNGSENKDLGVTLKYTDQALNNKAVKLVNSLKYKKALKEGTDFTVTLTKADAAEGTPAVTKTEGATPAKTPTGVDKEGAYTLRIDGKGNYSGHIEKTVYIANKDKLLKNAKITIKKKTLNWADKGTPSYVNYDEANWGGFCLTPGTSKEDAKDFTVSMGKTYLTNNQANVNDKDSDKSKYFISYTANNQAGIATITVTGNGIDYIGTKSATFKIQGTAFKAGAKPGNITLPEELTAPEGYTGEEITKEGVLGALEIVGGSSAPGNSTGLAALAKGTHYTVDYKNNTKKGTATVIITANPESGYTGSIKKTFKIAPADLKKAVKEVVDTVNVENTTIVPADNAAEGIKEIIYEGLAPYSKAGAVVSSLVFKNAKGETLRPGTDYTVKYSYTDKKDKKAGSDAVMTLKGKGNYSGTLEVKFKVTKAAYTNLDISVASVKLGNKAVKPKVTVKDGKKALTVSEDGKKEVKVTYAYNTPAEIEKWLAAGAPDYTETPDNSETSGGSETPGNSETSSGSETPGNSETSGGSGTPSGSETVHAPIVTIEIMDKNNYESTLQPVIRTLNVYKEKLDKKKITINWTDSEKKTDFTYNGGEQVKPSISGIKYGDTTYTVREIGGVYYACEIDAGTNKVKATVFKISYGANNKSGKNAGSVTIEALRHYGGTYTEKFTIHPKSISKEQNP